MSAYKAFITSPYVRQARSPGEEEDAANTCLLKSNVFIHMFYKWKQVAMETSRLRAFCALVETGNLREAAKVVHLSPGALSKSIQQLEIELNAQLFLRSKQRLILNAKGETAYKAAKRILEESEQLKRSLTEAVQESLVLRLGSYSTFTTYFLGPLLKEVMGENPLAIHPLLPGEIEAALLDRTIDLGITSFPVAHEQVHLEKVSEFEMGVYARRGAFAGVAFEQLPFAVPFIKFSHASIGGRTLDAWPDSQARTIKYYINGLESLLEACRNGSAAAVFPKFVVDLHNQQVKEGYRLEPRALPAKMKKISLNVFLLTRKAEAKGPFYDGVRQTLRKVCSRR
jgi:DNA-binding transcriptional LysR family regulator